MSRTTGESRKVAAAWILGGIAFATLLSGCQSIREATGAAKTPPDEFTVLTKSPLVIPPDFNLRPPQQGIASRNDPDADETGGSLNLPQGGGTAANLGPTYSDGEKLLLTKTNALSVDPNIRKTITTDVGLEDQGPGFAQKVLFQGPDAAKPAAPAAMGTTAGAASMPPAAVPAAATAGAMAGTAGPAPMAMPAPAAAMVMPAPAAMAMSEPAAMATPAPAAPMPAPAAMPTPAPATPEAAPAAPATAPNP